MKSGKSINSGEILNRVGGDADLLQELIGIFFEEYPRRLAEIKAAGERRDFETLLRAAHTLKGQIAFFGAPVAHELALQLEMMGRNRELGGCPRICTALETEMRQLSRQVAKLAGKSNHENSGCR